VPNLGLEAACVDIEVDYRILVDAHAE